MIKTNDEHLTSQMTSFSPKYTNNFFEHNMLFVQFILLCLLNSILGILFAGLIEITSKHIDIKYGHLTSLTYQVSINIIFFGIIRYYIFPYLIVQLQSITPGLFFVAFYFGLQATLYNNAMILVKKILGDTL